MLVVVEKMYHNLLLAKVIVKGAVGVQITKNIEFLYTLYRDKSWRACWTSCVMWRKLECIVLPLQKARIKKII
jgi:hypothetical protein